MAIQIKKWGENKNFYEMKTHTHTHTHTKSKNKKYRENWSSSKPIVSKGANCTVPIFLTKLP